MEKVGHDENTKSLNHNGDTADHQVEPEDDEKLCKEEATPSLGCESDLPHSR